MIEPAGPDGDPFLFRRPLGELIAALQGGSLSAVTLTAHYLARIERLNPRINAVVSLDGQALAAAKESDGRLRSGRARSPLEGVPVLLKDNLLMAGCPATWGSALFADFRPDADERPVARLRAGGAILLGKTNTPEFAQRGFTDNALFGPTRNPWDPARTPGGSSGGAAAAVAAGLAPLALGTDGAGSIRRPAAHTGLVGLKPGLGAIRRGGGFPSLNADFEVAAPIGRTVADVRMSASVLYQPGPAATAVGFPTARILFVERFGDAPVDGEILASARAAADRLSGLGHTVVRGALPLSLDAAADALRMASEAGFAALARQEPRFFDIASDDFAALARQGGAHTAESDLKAAGAVAALRAEAARLFEAFDVVLTPATAAQPWPADQAYPPVIDGRPVGPRGHAVFTGWVNVCGLPALALPSGFDRDGLPIGVQLVGALGRDQALLSLAEQFERSAPWVDLWPPLALLA